MFLAKVNDQDFFAFRYMLTWGFPSGSACKESSCHAGDLGSIPGLGRSAGEGTASHSSILAWRILWTAEPAMLQSMGSQRVRPDGTTFSDQAQFQTTLARETSWEQSQPDFMWSLTLVTKVIFVSADIFRFSIRARTLPVSQGLPEIEE